MIKNYINCLVTTLLLAFGFLVLGTVSGSAQQLPDPSFEDWSDSYNGDAQPKYWHGSNVTQVGFKFTFLYQKEGRTGKYCAYVADKEVGAAGITENAPGYFSLGQPWQYLESVLKVSEATAGTSGGINFTYRPDTMQVWIKRTGDRWASEDFHLLFYSWKGTAQSNKYKGKNGKCTSHTETNEESDIRLATDGNECGTATKATQISEGWLRDRQQYNDWTLIKVPIYYMNDDAPEKCNVIISAGNYPNFRANSGLNVGNAIYADDIELIYSAKIQKLYLNNKEWAGFDPNSTEEQVYSVGKTGTIPSIVAVRGAGQLTNTKNETTTFPGRRLTSSEMTITEGQIDGDPTIITVKSGDGKSTMTYKIKFISQPSDNSRLAKITINDADLDGYSAYVTSYNVALPYGTTKTPVVGYVKAEDAQTVTVTQPTSVDGKATIKVVAADGATTTTYTLNFSVAQLSDNTLQGIKIDGEEIADFYPSTTTYKVTLPLSTESTPKVEAISAYPAGAQTIEHIAPDEGWIANKQGQYQLKVTTPGNSVAKVYKLNFKIEASDNSKLKDLQVLVGGVNQIVFIPNNTTYYVTLPIGTTSEPEITYEQGDKYQTVNIERGGLDGVTKVTVTAGNGSQTIYKIVLSTEKSSNSLLKALYVGGELIDGFDPNVYTYNYTLPIGTTELPEITWETGDEYQVVNLLKGGLTGATRITVTAGDGSVTLYTINFSQQTSSVATLKMIYVAGKQLPGFDPEVLEYSYALPLGTTKVPEVTYDQGDEYQTVTTRSGGVNGDYKIIVRPQSGASQTYIIHFSVSSSSNVNLNMIYLDGVALTGFEASTLEYTVTLAMGVDKLPSVTYDKGEEAQGVIIQTNGNVVTLKVTAEDGTTQTYTITFVTQTSTNATLKMIYVDGKELEGFEPNKLEYSYQLAKGTTVLPEITYEKGDEYQNVTTRSGGVNGDYKITVRPQTGASQTYTIHFSVETSSDVTLKMIYLDGAELTGFNPTTLTYTVSLGVGVTTLPTVTYDKNDDTQKVLQQTSGNTITLRVTAEDGTQQTYSITFVTQQSSNKTLAMIYVDGERLENFDGNTLEYTITLPIGQTKIPTVTYDKGESTQKIQMQTSGNTVTIKVMAEDGSSQTYTINFVLQTSSDATLKMIYVDGEQLEGFSPDVLEYDYSLPQGTTSLPEVTYEKNDELQTVTTRSGGINGDYKITVRPQSGASQTYTIHFSVLTSSNANLSMIYLDGEALADFEPTKTVYQITLPNGSESIPVVSYDKSDESQRVLQDVDGMVVTLKVTAEDGSQQTYTITFFYQKSTSVTLEMIYIDGVEIEGFQASILSYNVALPVGETKLPTVTYKKGDESQRVLMLTDDNVVTLKVTAEDGSQEVYVVTFEFIKSSEVGLQMVYIDGEEYQDFETDILDYEIQLPIGQTKIPNITFVAVDDNAKVMREVSDNTVTLIVTSDDGTTQTYTFTFIIQQSSNAQLQLIMLDGEPLEGFNPGLLDYEYALAVGKQNLPTITYQTAEESQRVLVTVDDMTVTLRVTAQDGTQLTYTIVFTKKVSDDSTLGMIFLDGEELEGFDPAQFNYDVTLELGRNSIPEITYLTQNDAQSVMLLRQDDNIVTLTVKAESGKTETYTIHFYMLKSTNALLEMIYLDGSEIDGFSSQTLTYSYRLSDREAPAITVDKAYGQQVTIFSPVGAGDAQILVTPQEGETVIYTIHFLAPASEEAILSGISINGEALTAFNPLVFNYTLKYNESMPEVTATAEEGLHIEKLVKNNVVVIKVSSFDGKLNTYILRFTKILSSNATLNNILLDGVQIEGFNANNFYYDIALEPNTALPTITYEQGDEMQNIYFGQVGKNQYAIEVVAEDGSSNVYTITFDIPLRTSTELLSIELDGEPLELVAGKYDYERDIVAGNSLPVLTYTAAEGQTTMAVTTAGLQQEIVVKAENGATAIYTIKYIEHFSENALLRNILLDGISLEGFNPDVYEYTDTLAWRTKVVPVINVVSAEAGQTITINYGSINDTTTIHVTAADNATTADYSIFFHVRKSSNVALEDLQVDGYEINFNAETTEYVVTLPPYTYTAPVILYEKAEPEQSVVFVNAPIDDVSTITVTAENGDERTYSISYIVEPATDANVLKRFIVAETEQTIEVEDGITDYIVDMPYGTDKFTIAYQKNYDEQTVLVQPGGILRPTVITVYGNREDTETVTYTVTPNISQRNPATLESITVNGEELADFTPDRYSYIVNVNSTPIVDVVTYEGAHYSIMETNSKHWKIHVVDSKYLYGNDYEIYFYYPNDVIPNSDFTNWTTAANNDAPKPTGWNCLADKFANSDVLGNVVKISSGTHTFGKNGEVEQVTVSGTNKAVGLNTKKSNGNWTSGVYGGALGGYLPAWITLGQIEGSLQEAGGSTFSSVGGIQFRNSPDNLIVKAKTGSLSNNENRIVYQLWGIGSAEVVNSTDANTNYKEYNFDLSSVNSKVSAPNQMNIILNSYHQESMTTLTNGSTAELYVDWVKFTYNNKLASMTADENPLTLSGNSFVYNKVDSEDTGIPVLTFQGEVNDQAQLVIWSEEEAGVRTAQIRNFGEDGNYTDYTLTVTRPLSKINTLKRIEVAGLPLSEFSAEQSDYTIVLPYRQHNLPDVVAVHETNLQNITLNREEDKVFITVKAEDPEVEDRVYSISFTREPSHDTDLQNIIANGVEFDQDTHEYTIEANAMPDIRFVKKSDAQKVTLDNGVLTVLAEDGTTTGTYTIVIEKPELITSGLLQDIQMNEMTIEGFNETVFDYEKPETSILSFVRKDPTDRVIEKFTPQGVTITVIGTEEHSYTIVYPTELSDNKLLSGILVNGESLADFVAQIQEYLIQSNEALTITVLPGEENQSITITVSSSTKPLFAPRKSVKSEIAVQTYTIEVVAENGEHSTYTITVEQQLSSSADLKSIMVDGAIVEGFRSDSTSYIVTLPAPYAKTAEPKQPQISYIAGTQGQTITVDKSIAFGEPTYITVESEDQSAIRDYDITVVEEPSHNAFLSNIVVDGMALSQFNSRRMFYSLQTKTLTPDVEFTTEDIFAKVTMENTAEAVILHVTAEDGSTTNDYQIDIYQATASSDATLKSILINGGSFEEFNPNLSFSPRQNTYYLPLVGVNAIIPDITAVANRAGQSITMEQDNMSIVFDVVAEDGVTTNSYVLNFVEEQSSDVTVDMIYLDGEPLQGFQPDQFVYNIELEIGRTTLPVVSVLKHEDAQTVSQQTEGQRTSVTITAENGARNTYILSFLFTESAADTLLAINDEIGLIAGFRPDSLYYEYTLPMNNRVVPDLTYRVADKWQTVTTQKVESALRSTTRFTVVAQNGARNIYSVVYNIPQSAADTLLAINDEVGMIQGFQPSVFNYEYLLSTNNHTVPQLTYQAADEWQVVTTQRTQDARQTIYRFFVKAENGQQNIYSVTYTIPVSDADTLLAINNNYDVIEGFEPHKFYYEYQLPLNNRVVPDISWQKADKFQTVTMQKQQNAHQTTYSLTVTAETGKSNVYTVVYLIPQSAADTLLAINNDFGMIDGFEPSRFNYQYTLQLNNRVVPNLTYRKADEWQTVTTQTIVNDRQTTYQFNVTAENGLRNIYTVTYIIPQSDADTLLAINDEYGMIEGFEPQKTEYHYELGDDVVALPQLTYEVADEWQTVSRRTIALGKQTTEMFTVRAESGKSRVYSVVYEWKYSAADTLLAINDDYGLIEGFEPQKFQYRYTLPLNNRKLPMLTYQVVDQWQKVALDTLEIGRETTYYFTVTAHDGSKNTYAVTYEVPISDNVHLSAIYDEEGVISGFDPEVFRYDFTLPTYHRQVPQLTYAAGDEWQSVTTQRTENNGLTTYQFTVIAENGLRGMYVVTYQVEPSAADTLLAISDQYGVIEGFRPDSLNYEYTLPLNNRVVPELTYEKADEWQEVTTHTIVNARQTMYQFSVVAENGNSKIYTVTYIIPQSSADTLLAINDNRGLINGFEPRKFNYEYVLPLNNRVVPELTYQQADEWQSVTTQKTENERQTVYQFNVVAENGMRNVYTVVYQVPKSNADTLLAINDEFGLIEGFESHKYYYEYTLPLANRVVPTLDYEVADEWQTVSTDTLTSQLQTTYRFNVEAESGLRNIYTVTYNIPQSAVDTLREIRVNNQLLEGFSGKQNDYVVTLPIGTTQMPQITYEAADEWQTVEVISGDLGEVTKLVVRAENGAQRIYSILIKVALSDNARLAGIQCQGLADFDEYKLQYNISLPFGTTILPTITWTKQEEMQQVSLSVKGMSATIHVVAEDGVTEQDYVIDFNVEHSSNALLKSIKADGNYLSGFDPMVADYVIDLPYGTTRMPIITWETNDNEQKVDTVTVGQILQIDVVAGDGITEMNYTVKFNIAASPINDITDILVRGISLQDLRQKDSTIVNVSPAGFRASEHTYTITYKLDSSEDVFFSVNDVEPILVDQKAMVSKLDNGDGVISITIIAEDGTAGEEYQIRQVIERSSNSLLKEITANGMLIRGFSPTTYYYEYQLMMGRTDVPQFAAVAQDEKATIEWGMVALGDTLEITCVAEDGSETLYQIYIHETDLNETVVATENDVLFKHKENDIFVAYSIRANTQIAIYDEYGKLIVMKSIPVCDPNSSLVVNDYLDLDLLYNVDALGEGAEIQVPNTNQTFYYVIFENFKHIVKTGKFVLKP